ncbi:Alpha/Beta hydrolase protein [Leptodontidium sp. MPI-SDFR-AT-0119]|nr:Alpha/Beta hydrolase protein [Leptodontidium sp. MPI-SDFR-AT-0119]
MKALFRSAVITAASLQCAALQIFNLDPKPESKIFTHESLPGHYLRLQGTNESVCSGGNGTAGYLDIDKGDKHIFFWAFESRNKPLSEPVILWLTGGPGCSGTGAGALVELGPCRIETENTTVSNPYSWNNNATVIFIDQPLNVGFSYSSQPITNLHDATVDTHNFLLLLFAAFPILQTLPFYISGESYGGSWVPSLATQIVDSQSGPFGTLAQQALSPPPARISLKGISLGNAALSDLDQWKGFYPTGCSGAAPLFNSSVCEKMAEHQPRCDRLLSSCGVSSQDPIICQAALDFCRETSVYAILDTGLNPYDFRKRCEGPMCYRIIDTATAYLNNAKIQEQLGVGSGFNFVQCNSDISRDFIAAGDQNRPSAKLVGRLLDHGLKVLVYVGNQDWLCNAAGVRSGVHELAWNGQSVFRVQEEQAWLVDGKVAGSMKVVGDLSFVEVFDAGHMVPLDKGHEASVLLNTWINQDL